jgi:hypothetical protein
MHFAHHTRFVNERDLKATKNAATQFEVRPAAGTYFCCRNVGVLVFSGEWIFIEKAFGETPPVAFVDPKTSKRMMKQALTSKTPFNEEDLDPIMEECPLDSSKEI